MSSAVLQTAFPSVPESEIRRVFERQLATALRWRTSTAEERIGRIKRLRDAVLAHRQQLYEAADRDFRKPAPEVDLGELLPVVSEANLAIRKLKKWMKPRGVWPTLLSLGLKGYVQYEPRGRCLIISPWNYPFNLAFGPLVSALAAGNPVILKPSEMTPRLSALMTQIIQAVFTEDEVAIFEGDATVAVALSSLPFDHIFFTGSPRIGKQVMAAAAQHLTGVTLELGGKSPTLVDESADLAAAAANILWGKFTNLGQTCIAPDHVYVHANVKEAFVEHCAALLKTRYGATPQEQMNSPSLARVVNIPHTRRLAALLDDARQKGARILSGGFVSEPDCFVAPTLLDNCAADSTVMQEEIFGPLLPLIPYRDLDEVIDRINAMPKPLALYVWSKSRENIRKVMSRTSSGGACINNTVVQYGHPNLPFGGINHSGMGSAHGQYGFKTFSHERAVVHTRFSLVSMFFPPYTERTRKLTQKILRSA
ncbi:MAG: aldehyde dehydrogenase family protein [Nevskiales bacterium]|nr:aldehyde dehydrogenase family protein [Nevskiales bacterium]